MSVSSPCSGDCLQGEPLKATSWPSLRDLDAEDRSLVRGGCSLQRTFLSLKVSWSCRVLVRADTPAEAACHAPRNMKS